MQMVPFIMSVVTPTKVTSVPRLNSELETYQILLKGAFVLERVC